MSNKLRFWLINAGFWAAYFVFNGANFFLHLLFDPLNRFIGLATHYFWILLITGIYVFIYHRFSFDEKPLRFQILQVWLSICIIFSLDLFIRTHINYALFPFLLNIVNEALANPNYYGKLLFDNKSDADTVIIYNTLIQHNNLMKFFAVSTWTVSYNLIQYSVMLRHVQVKKLKAENKLKDAELTNLRQQLNPHFLFNALNSIQTLASLKDDKTEDAIMNLSDLMRYHLNYEKRDFVKVQEEMDTVKKYLELEKIRYGKRLNFEIQLDEAVANQEIPLIMVQTLVENAIKHGVRYNKKGATISVSAKKEDDYLKIEVTNTGQYTPKALISKNSGIGLDNTQKRLEILYGNTASLSIGNRNDTEVTASLIFPITSNKQ
jgi:two-component system, LytTR family, sensor kinase